MTFRPGSEALRGLRWVVGADRVEVGGADIEAERVAAGLGGPPSPVVALTEAAEAARPFLGLREGADLTGRLLAGAQAGAQDMGDLAKLRDPLALWAAAALDDRLSATVGRHHREPAWWRMARRPAITAAVVLAAPPLLVAPWWTGAVRFTAGLALALTLAAAACILRAVWAARPHIRLGPASPPATEPFVSRPLRRGPRRRWSGPPLPVTTSGEAMSST